MAEKEFLLQKRRDIHEHSILNQVLRFEVAQSLYNVICRYKYAFD